MATVWQRALLALCAITALAVGAILVDQTGLRNAPWFGFWDAQGGASAVPYQIQVLGVAPTGSSARAGLRAGDRIDLRRSTVLERFEILTQPLAERPIPLTVMRNGSQRVIVVTPRPLSQNRWDVEASTVGLAWLVLFAAIISWRQPFVRGNLLLATVLLCYVIGSIGAPNFGSFGSPWVWQYILASACWPVFAVSIALWAAYTATFGAPISQARRVALWLCYACSAVAAGAGLAWLIGMVALTPDPVELGLSLQWAVPLDAAVLVALLCSILAIRASRGPERQRALWAMIPLDILYVVFVSYQILVVLQTGFYWGSSLGTVVNVAYFLVPCVLAYAALTHRLVDVGFILNRAAVFAVLSAFVVGVFVLVEWLAGQWLVNAGHASGVAFGMIVALGLGFSLRYVHRYVDHFVDNVFFRKRHDDETALRRFAHESAYIADRSVVLHRALENVREHTGARDAFILVRDGTGRYVCATNGTALSVSEDDPGLVQLRAWGKAIAIHGRTDSRLEGELAFPMISRGVLIGALVCGAKRDGEGYAPDETDALFELAHGVGTALDMLSVKEAEESTRLMQLQILERLSAMSRKLGV